MSKSNRELAVELLKAYRNWIALAVVVAIGAVIVLGIQLPTISLSRPHKVFLVALLIAGLVGSLPASRIVAYLYDPPKRYVVVPSIHEQDEPGVWELTPKQFQDLYVPEGNLYEWPGTKHPTYEALSYDPEENMAVGTWRGSATDSDLIRAEQEIKRIRQELERRAREGEILKTRAKSITRQAILENTRTLLAQYDRVNPLDPARVDELIEETLESADWEAEIESQRSRKTAPEESMENGQETGQDRVVAAEAGGSEEPTDE